MGLLIKRTCGELKAQRAHPEDEALVWSARSAASQVGSTASSPTRPINGRTAHHRRHSQMKPSIPSDRTLQYGLKRTTKFLTAAGTHARVRRQLAQAHYSAQDHAEGWALYLSAAGGDPRDLEVAEAPPPSPAHEAIFKLDELDGPLLKRLDAVLAYDHPEQAAILTQGLSPGTGGEAVANVESILKRVEHLRAAPERQPTREADAAALKALSLRGMGEPFWANLSSLVEQAQTLQDTEPLPEVLTEEVLRARRFAVYKWIRKWSILASEAITSRRILIQLGLARLRRNASTGKDEVVSDDFDTDGDDARP